MKTKVRLGDRVKVRLDKGSFSDGTVVLINQKGVEIITSSDDRVFVKWCNVLDKSHEVV